MKKKLAFLGAIILTFFALIYFDGNRTIYDHWYKGKKRDISKLYKEVETIRLRESPESNVTYFVIHDTRLHGFYCTEVENTKRTYVCTPMTLKKSHISPEDTLIDIIKTSDSKKGFLAKISYNYFFFYKKLNIKVAPLNMECLTENNCVFKRVDTYLTSDYDLVRKYYVINSSKINY